MPDHDSAARRKTGLIQVRVLFILTLLSLLIFAPARAATREPFTREEVQAFYAYDANQPLDVTLTLEADFPTYQRYLITYQSEGETVTGAYFKPKREGKVPGLVGVHGIWSDRREQFWVVAEAAVKNGYAVLLPSLPYHHQRRTRFSLVSGQQFITNDIARTRENFRRAVIDMRRGLDWLLAQPEVNSEQVGMAGVSLGGVIAAAALKVDPRLKVGILAVTAGNLTQNILYADIAVVKLLRFWLGMGMLDYDQAIGAWSIADPLLLPGAEETPVLMLNATNDEIFTVSSAEALYRTFRRADIIWATSLHQYPERPAQIQMVEYINRQFDWHPQLRTANFVVTETLPSYPKTGDASLSYTAELLDAAGASLRLEVEVAMVNREKAPVFILDQGLDEATKGVLKRSGVSLLYVPDADDEARRRAGTEYLAETSFADLSRLFYARRTADANGWEVLALTPDGRLAPSPNDPGKFASPLKVRDLFVHLRQIEGAAPDNILYVKAIPAASDQPVAQAPSQ